MPHADHFGPLRGEAPPVVHALDFSAWKRPFVRHCFPASDVKFVSHLSAVPRDGCVLLWGRREPESLPQGVRVLRVEDGFVRSVGLGADLVRPMSWVIDSRGIHYDANSISDLEHLLQTTDFDDALRQRARALGDTIVSDRLTKYNVAARPWQRPSDARRTILVPGQVETDASLAFGAPGIRRNMDLLRAVRTAHPDAYVVYKPHPDVVARLRAAGQDESSALRWCDEVAVDVSMDSLLDAVDELHVMTSLAGFEALLRRKRVTCHGLPFYAGWGLTTDHIPCPRRSRKLTLDELVAGVLIRYPVYFDRNGTGRVSPETALEQLRTWREQSGGRQPWWRPLMRMVLRQVVGVR
ncbi:capsule polysaccharide biosynthesis protein [Azoarcus sp. KH32C]|uniref:capsular polysaccharide export protein, LipB/KpsS family n=1 Tax=Azoarcus sp. KH32C TaxID=748247 RepID=UPI00023866A4|nr:capsule polysaccharide biosynthesis protein [Azoarcus sp. KH32C]BAL22581.1 capsule polysaccharide biosynthesis protein [Azoarcus sp. KH32C]